MIEFGPLDLYDDDLAQANTHMLAVNKAPSFYDSGFTHEWAKDL